MSADFQGPVMARPAVNDWVAEAIDDLRACADWLTDNGPAMPAVPTNPTGDRTLILLPESYHQMFAAVLWLTCDHNHGDVALTDDLIDLARDGQEPFHEGIGIYTKTWGAITHFVRRFGRNEICVAVDWAVCG